MLRSVSRAQGRVQSPPAPTFSCGLDADDVAVVSVASSRHSNHPDTVLAVPAQVGDAVEEHVWGGFKLAAHLVETDRTQSLVVHVGRALLSSKWAQISISISATLWS